MPPCSPSALKSTTRPVCGSRRRKASHQPSAARGSRQPHNELDETILALVILFAVYAFSDAILQGSRAFNSDSAGSVAGHLLLGLIDTAAGVVAIVWPGPTVLVLVIVVAIWAVIGGIAEFAFAFAAGETAGTRALFLLGGLVSIAFGVVLFARPGAGAYTLALLFGLFALIYGISQIAGGIQLRSAGKDARELLHSAA